MVYNLQCSPKPSLLAGSSLYMCRRIGRVSGRTGTSKGENSSRLPPPPPLALSLVPDLPLTRPTWRPDFRVSNSHAYMRIQTTACKQANLNPV